MSLRTNTVFIFFLPVPPPTQKQNTHTVNTAIYLSSQFKWPFFRSSILDLPLTHTYKNTRSPTSLYNTFLSISQRSNPHSRVCRSQSTPDWQNVSILVLENTQKLLAGNTNFTITECNGTGSIGWGEGRGGVGGRQGELSMADWRLYVFITFPFWTVKTTLMYNSLKTF